MSRKSTNIMPQSVTAANGKEKRKPLKLCQSVIDDGYEVPTEICPGAEEDLVERYKEVLEKLSKS